MKNYYYILLIYLLNRLPLTVLLGLNVYGTAINLIELFIFIYMFSVRGFRNVVFKKINLIWIALVIYHLVNYVIKVPAERPINMVATLATCTLLMMLTEFLYLKSPEKTLKYLIYGYLIFIIIAFNVVSVDADFDNRLRGEGMHPNQFAHAAGVGLLILGFTKFRLNTPWKIIIILTIPGLLAILGCGSRNGLLLFFIYVFVLFLGKQIEMRMSMEKLLQILLIFTVLYIVGNYMLENTMVGERLLKTSEQSESYSSLQTGIPILDLMGDRGVFYYMGWMNFMDNPITGIGLYNFANYNQHSVPIHSEYLIHLAEGGSIAAVLYLYFIFYILRNLMTAFRKEKSATTFVLLAMFIAYLIVGVTARCFNVNQFYPLLGLCIAYVFMSKNRIYDTNKRGTKGVYSC